jgi:epoxide hydrolase
MNIKEFRAEVPQAELDELNSRLQAARWPDQLPDVGWSYGVERSRLQDLVEYWRTSYDWRKFEAKLNAHPQYVTEIDGQRVHFIHTKSTATNTTPLLLLHGWPGAASDFLELIGRCPRTGSTW